MLDNVVTSIMQYMIVILWYGMALSIIPYRYTLSQYGHSYEFEKVLDPYSDVTSSHNIELVGMHLHLSISKLCSTKQYNGCCLFS